MDSTAVLGQPVKKSTTLFRNMPLRSMELRLTSTVCQYINVDTREECCTGFESHKIFTGDMLGEWGEDEDGNECICILGIVTYWESEGRYVLTDKDGLCNDWTLEDEAQPVNWPKLIHCGSIHDGEGGQ